MDRLLKSWALQIAFFLIIFQCQNLFAQPVTREELARELQKCDLALQESQQQIKILSAALKATDSLMFAHKNATDNLIANLKAQLQVQDSVSVLMKMNSDTLQAMVRDYSAKLDEVNQLYISELKKQTRSWFFTSNGLKGLVYGVFIGGALGLTFAILK